MSESESHSVVFDSLGPRGLEFSRPEYWSGCSFPSPGALPNPGIEPRSPALQVDCLPAQPQEKPHDYVKHVYLRLLVDLIKKHGFFRTACRHKCQK